MFLSVSVCVYVWVCVWERVCVYVFVGVYVSVCACACVYLFQDTLVTFLLTVILHQVDFYSTELQSHSQRVMLLIEIYIKKHLILTYINIVLHCYLHKSLILSFNNKRNAQYMAISIGYVNKTTHTWICMLIMNIHIIYHYTQLLLVMDSEAYTYCLLQFTNNYWWRCERSVVKSRGWTLLLWK